MPRSREAVQAQVNEARSELERLEAKLAAIQPDELTIANDCDTAAIRCSISGGDLLVCGGRSPVNVEHAYIGFFKPAEAGDLRDWLNYHFPKTEENA